jgi:ribosome-associated protein
MQKEKRFSTDMKTLTKEAEISFYKSSGPGGQKKNKTESSVRLRHPPSGVTVIASEQRSQAQNRELAFKRLQRKLAALNRVPKPRVKSQMPKEAKERLLKAKRELAEKKRQRQKPQEPETL